MTAEPAKGAAGPARPRYKAIHGGSLGHSRPARIFAAALAPVVGSRQLFPHVLARGLHSARDNGRPALFSSHARWFFGKDLFVWADPKSLNWRLHERVHNGRSQVNLSSWFLDAADWKEAVTPVRQLVEHRETLELVEFGPRYPEMPSFRKLAQLAAEKRPAVRYGARLDTEERIHEYFRYFLRLIDSIREHGFREQKDAAVARMPAGFAVRGRYALSQRNIGAAVNANGRLIRFLGGRHRTAIAQALAVPAVPVEIRLVHADWLAAESARAGLDPASALRAWVQRVSAPAPKGP